MSNPQSDDTLVQVRTSHQSHAGANRRTRNGDPVQQVQQQEARALINKPILQQLDVNQKRLNAIETEHNNRTSTCAKLDQTLKSLESRINTNQLTIGKIFYAQITQGNLIKIIHNKQIFLEGNLLKLCTHFGIEVEKPPVDKDTSTMDIDQTLDLDTEMDALEDEHQQLTPPVPLTLSINNFILRYYC